MSVERSTRTFFLQRRPLSAEPDNFLPKVDGLIQRVETLSNFKQTPPITEALDVLGKMRSTIYSAIDPTATKALDSNAVDAPEPEASALKRA